MPGTVTRDVRSSVRRGLAGDHRIVLAISGGIDSMVLLDAAATSIPPRRLIVATFDHGTGPHSRQAAKHVAQSAATLGVECVAGRADAPVTTEAELREARWRFLRAVAARERGTVATAHTLDDQIETVFMRVLRDAGARGLAALYAESSVVRPLLEFRRGDIVRYAAAEGVRWVEDPTNASMRFLRNRVRRDLLPALRRARPSIEADLLGMARDAAQWRKDVDDYVSQTNAVKRVSRGAGLDIDIEMLHGHSPNVLRSLLPAIAARGGVTLDRRGIARFAEFVERSRVGARMQLSGGWDVIRSRDALQLRASSEAKPTPAPLALSQETEWCAWSFQPAAAIDTMSAWSACLPTDRPLVIRSWHAGDVMRSPSSGRARKVKTLLTKAGVTGHDRSTWPVVVAGDDIVWIPGVRRSDAATDPSGRSGLSFVCEHVNR